MLLLKDIEMLQKSIGSGHHDGQFNVSVFIIGIVTELCTHYIQCICYLEI